MAYLAGGPRRRRPMMSWAIPHSTLTPGTNCYYLHYHTHGRFSRIYRMASAIFSGVSTTQLFMDASEAALLADGSSKITKSRKERAASFPGQRHSAEADRLGMITREQGTVTTSLPSSTCRPGLSSRSHQSLSVGMPTTRSRFPHPPRQRSSIGQRAPISSGWILSPLPL